MRTVVFMGLVMISSAIGAGTMWMVAESSKQFIFTILCVAAMMDVIEFIIKVKHYGRRRRSDDN